MRPELRIRAIGKDAVLRLPLGDGAPTITGGHGGYEAVARPGRVAATRYVGSDPLGQDIPILLGGFRGRTRSVQPQIDRLIALSRPVGGRPPAVVQIGGPVHRTSLRWVINGIQWGDAMREPGIGIVRQELTLQLLQYVRPDQVRTRRQPSMTSSWGPRTVTVAAGDTWRKLAAKHLGDASKGKALAKANGNKPAAPTTPLKAGRRVRLP